MTTITAAAVKELRDKTGAGMMDCKAALNATNGDMDAAVDWLRAKGLAKAAKKAGRAAAEGLIGAAADATSAVLVEVNSETDFVARNEQFQAIVANVAKVALGTNGTVEAVRAAAYPGSKRTVEEEITEAVAAIGENMSLRRTVKLSSPGGIVAVYVHGQVAPNLGRIGVLVALKSTGDRAKLQQIGRQVAMHIAAANPLALRPDELDKDTVARERGVFAEQARASGKPDAIIEKMVDGRMRKYYAEVVLLEQAFVHEPDISVSAAVKRAEAEVGAPISVEGFRVLKIGEGVEKTETDFAAEVAAAAGVKV